MMIPNGVDVNRFRPARIDERETLRIKFGLPTTGSVVLFVGYFSGDKCPDVLFEAWLRATEGLQAPTALFFVGATRPTYHEISSPLVERVRRESTLLEGTNRRVVFLESILDVEQVYRCADVFVLPSVREGLPNALLEAMASGLGCVASRLEGVTDSIIQDGVNGRLVEPTNVEELSNVLQVLLAQPNVSTDMGRRARKTIEMQFNLRDTGRKHLAAYRSLDSGSA
jgi:glycosyltransferase involved in cell wall biosynthesis